MAITIDLTPEEEADLEAEAIARGLELSEFAKQRLLRAMLQDAQGVTWGASVVEEWKKAGVIGKYGDMSRDSPEYARDLRCRMEADLFPRTADAA